jgi:hypothetical protein
MRLGGLARRGRRFAEAAAHYEAAAALVPAFRLARELVAEARRLGREARPAPRPPAAVRGAGTAEVSRPGW